MGTSRGYDFDHLVAASLPPNTLLFIKVNILIDQNHRARLTDFGLVTIDPDPTNLANSSSFQAGGTVRWMSPELISPEQFGYKDCRPTKESDCYALGMVILEVLSGKVPFQRYPDFLVIVKVIEGIRPKRPGGGLFTNELWGILGQCWAAQPGSRPSIEVVLKCLGRVSRTWVPPPSPGG